jgi:Uma2 family endonuclease
MATVLREVEPLSAGDHLTRDEFFRRWEAMPHIKRAELIGGIVHVTSPLSADHGRITHYMSHWLGHYALYTPGCDGGGNATWLMLTDSPQPDVHLRIASGPGATSKEKGEYLEGAPEFIVEVCLTSASYDLHEKLDLYRTAGVKEYLALLIHGQEVRWHRLVAKSYQLMPEPRDGIYRSDVFPGLWLDASALFEGNMMKVIETLERGLHTPEHDAFVKELASRRS